MKGFRKSVEKCSDWKADCLIGTENTKRIHLSQKSCKCPPFGPHRDKFKYLDKLVTRLKLNVTMSKEGEKNAALTLKKPYNRSLVISVSQTSSDFFLQMWLHHHTVWNTKKHLFKTHKKGNPTENRGNYQATHCGFFLLPLLHPAEQMTDILPISSPVCHSVYSSYKKFDNSSWVIVDFWTKKDLLIHLHSCKTRIWGSSQTKWYWILSNILTVHKTQVL